MEADSPKKIRERKLIEQFLAITPQFRGYTFDFYDENPDLVYQRNGVQLGFESILVLPSRDSHCRLDAATCSLWLPLRAVSHRDLVAVQTELARTLFEHLRHYKVPTVIVFTLQAPSIQLEQVAAHFALPEVVEHNIADYFITDSQRSIQLTETRRI
jgi:hypothetical protein